MVDILLWLIAVEIVGLVALPFAFVLFHRLPDRGYTLAMPLGILFVSYIVWLLGYSKVIPYSQVTIVAVLLLMAVVGVLVLRPRAKEFGRFLAQEGGTIILAQGIFLAVFFAWVLVRAHDPFVNHTERPMDFAFLNSLVAARSFPPEDPWLAGQPIAYYYFGFLMMATLTKLTAVSTLVSYNLAMSLVPALAAMGAFGLVYNAVRLARGSAQAATLAGLLGALFFAWISNLEGVLELLKAAGLGSGGFWHWVGVKGLDGPAAASNSWHPGDTWWWWRASRVVDTVVDGRSLDYTINEFPFFSFLLGNLHPHVLGLPFGLLAMALGLNVLASPERLGLRWLRSAPLRILAISLTLGALGFISTWDLPTYSVLVLGALLLKCYQQRERFREAFLAWLPVAVAVVLGVAVLYFFFFFGTMGSQASGILPVREIATQPLHFFLVWGLFIVIATSFLLRQLASLPGDKRWQPGKAAWSVFWGFAPFLAWAVVDTAMLALESNLGHAPAAVGKRFLHILPPALGISVALYSLMVRRREDDSPGMAFALALLGLGYFLVMMTDLFYVVDLFGTRMNTVFKVYYQGWAILAIASAFGLYYWNARHAISSDWARLGGYFWWGAVGVLILASMYYPPAAIDGITAGLKGSPTLNALGFVARVNPADYRAMLELRKRAEPGDVVLEAVGPEYSQFGIVSASTGIPTVVGWPGHELQWRGSSLPFNGRPEDVQEIYKTASVDKAQELLAKYHVKYVYVGPRERIQYGAQGLDKFSGFMTVVFSEGDVIIYKRQG